MNKYLFVNLILCLFLLSGCKRDINSDIRTPFLNLDFKETISGTDKPERWFLGESGYDIRRIVKSDGQTYEMKIYSAIPQPGDFGMINNHIPVEIIKGKKVLIKARIKTDNVTSGHAGLWCGINQPYGPMDFAEWKETAITGTADWKEISVEKSIPEYAEGFNFAGILNGKGVAWFDNFEVYIDGEKFVDKKGGEPAISELVWLKSNLHPLKSYNPEEPSDDDLKELNYLIKDAKVVALGEVTHGSSEIFRMKHRIIKYLAEKKDFNIFSLEATMANAHNINEYTINGADSVNALLDNLSFWTWNTQEMYDFTTWMKKYNETGNKMVFTGFDMQMYQGAIDELRKSFLGDKATLTLIKSLESKLSENMQRIVKDKAFHDSVPPALKKNIDELSNKISIQIEKTEKSKEEKGWLIQQVRVITQSLDTSDEGRDKAMADNFMWLMNHHKPESKFVIWGHNAHISKGGTAMGHHLSRELLGNYINIGFTFYEGSYTAMGDKGLTAYEAQKAYPGTYEYYFNKVDYPIFILDLRKVRENKKDNVKWLHSKLPFRTTGALKTDNEFHESDIVNDYDLIIFINKSTPSKLLKSY